MKGKKKSSSGITLIALVITIIVLLILAGVSIATLTGDNGILDKATIARERNREGEAKEIIDLVLQEWQGEKYTGTNMTLEEFLNSKKSSGELDEVIKNDDGTFTVEKDGYEVKVADDGNVIEEISKAKGIRPKIQGNLYQEDGNPINETIGYETVILTVKVANKDEIEKANGQIDEIIVKDKGDIVINKETTTVGDGEASFKVKGSETYIVTVKATVDGVQKETKITIVAGKVPAYWKATTKEDTEWYGYTDIGAETPTRANVNAPKLKGQMTPIKYVGDKTQTGSKWANATTADGSMWVWIPRYAYRIKEEYYHKSTAGEIEVAFIDTNNQLFLNNGDSGEITENPAEENAGITKWLVHPAFTANAENGGGFGNLEGLWVGKFEATGTSTAVSVKPGVSSWRKEIINDFFKAAQKAKYGEGETVHLGSHMAKNSEWGVTVYLAHSKYGTNGQAVENNASSSFCTGGSSVIETIYTTNKNQSTTYNATGVYDLNGGAVEYVAAYPNNGSKALKSNGGINVGDLYGADEKERTTSTKYKTVYPKNYGETKTIKGDAGYETSGATGIREAWFGASAVFPTINNTFFRRGGFFNDSYAGSFCFIYDFGGADGIISFRPVLAF